jgi:beta-mannanase
MKRVLFILLTLAGILMISLFAAKHQSYLKRLLKAPKKNTIETNAFETPLAMFSFHPNAQTKMVDSCFHFTIQLHNTKKSGIKKSEIEHIAEHLPILFTIKAWKTSGISSYENNVLTEIAAGKYDKVLEELCTGFIGNRPNVYFRLNPDMEVPVNRYPWQQIGGQAYIAAFRHFALVCKKHAPQVKLMWGPAGYPGTMEFYPGNDVVDAASVTIKSDSEISLNVYPKDYTVAYDIFRRVHRLRFIGKPVFLLASKQIDNEAVDEQLLFALAQKINNEREIIYSSNNFKHLESDKKDSTREKIEIGIFDEFERLNGEEPVTVEHLFADFRKLGDGTFQNEFKKAIGRGNDVIVTFEPFFGPNAENDLEVLQNISDGKYDVEINRLYSVILSTDKKIYLRFAHEMEIPITRYPWQSQDPLTYIKSYRYFMTFKDALPANIKRVWGPAGDRGSLEWYPGNDVVDFISIAIYGLPDKNITDPEKQESFEKIFNRKYWRIRFINKPLFITEFGVKGPEDYQTRWLEEAAKIIRENPQIKGVNYFNMSDTPKAWGEIKPPDWSITKNTFYRFLEVLNNSRFKTNQIIKSED